MKLTIFLITTALLMAQSSSTVNPYPPGTRLVPTSVGPAGATGATGANGAAGATGGTGATGPAPSGTGILLNLTSATPSAFPSITRVTSAVNATTTTLANITGLTYSLTSGTYMVMIWLPVTPSAGGGTKFRLNYTGTTSASNLGLGMEQGTGIDPLVLSGATINTDYAGNVADATAGKFTMQGTFVATASGTLTLQFAQSTASGTSTVGTGGYMMVLPVI